MIKKLFKIGLYLFAGFWALVTLMIVIVMLVVPSEQPEEEANESTAASFFEANRDSILTHLRTLVEAEEYNRAENAGFEYEEVDDPEFWEVYNQAREQVLLDQARRIPASFTRENLEIYNELLSIDPSNTRYQERAAHYRGIIDQRRQAHRDHVARYGEPPEQRSWGSYDVVRDYLQARAHDPRSIDIDTCTSVRRTDGGWLIGCDYRGKNAFGAVVRNSHWFIVRHGRVVAQHPFDRYSL